MNLKRLLVEVRSFTILLLLTNLSVFGQSESKTLRKACRVESDSIFEIFLDHWKCNVKINSIIQGVDSLEGISQLINDFYEDQIGMIQNDEIYGFKDQYLIFDLRMIQVEVVHSDLKAERLLIDSIKNSKINIHDYDCYTISTPIDYAVCFFSDKSKWEIASKYKLEDFNCYLTYDKVLYLNDTYLKLHNDFVNRRKLFGNRASRKFYSDRMYYYWIYLESRSINKVTMFSSGKFAMISCSSESVGSVEFLYNLSDNGWKPVWK